MRLPDPQQRGFALPLALTTSALLLLSSLSLQTLALHARQRSSQALVTAQTRDAERSVAMAFKQHAAGAHACLLALPSSEWDRSERCPGLNPGQLRSGRVADRAIGNCWIGNLKARELERCNSFGVTALRAGSIWSCCHDAHGSCGFCGDPWHK